MLEVLAVLLAISSWLYFIYHLRRDYHVKDLTPAGIIGAVMVTALYYTFTKDGKAEVNMVIGTVLLSLIFIALTKYPPFHHKK
ncbi:hypothetical protein [Bacillus marinisedimentorum]|uniref:hypothetical protein n=1 Tax=Bacillus marinisedimentorum TaxID=1821260 RepID=UPI000872965C|nr:hypothetical protein [Bacillus marinisedimentorum]